MADDRGGASPVVVQSGMWEGEVGGTVGGSGSGSGSGRGREAYNQSSRAALQKENSKKQLTHTDMHSPR